MIVLFFMLLIWEVSWFIVGVEIEGFVLLIVGLVLLKLIEGVLCNIGDFFIMYFFNEV